MVYINVSLRKPFVRPMELSSMTENPPCVTVIIRIHVLMCKYAEQLAHEYSRIHDLCQHLNLALPIQLEVLGHVLEPFDWHATT